MREIVMDTETTGLDPDNGDRIVEIGCIEIINHKPTGNNFHEYINPERDMPQAAFAVHGLSEEFLSDKPIFAELGQKFLDYIGDSPLVIHNAKFDMRFLNAELKRMKLKEIPYSRAIDTLEIAKRLYPGARLTLDALCRRFHIDNSGRVLHGALLDSELLAEVYIELIGGKQPDLSLKEVDEKANKIAQLEEAQKVTTRKKPLGSLLTDEEKAAHEEHLKELKNAQWLN